MFNLKKNPMLDQKIDWKHWAERAYNGDIAPRALLTMEFRVFMADAMKDAIEKCTSKEEISFLLGEFKILPLEQDLIKAGFCFEKSSSEVRVFPFGGERVEDNVFALWSDELLNGLVTFREIEELTFLLKLLNGIIAQKAYTEAAVKVEFRKDEVSHVLKQELEKIFLVEEGWADNYETSRYWNVKPFLTKNDSDR